MKLQKIRSAFTLIELLVVITIIGILATGAVNVYTSQIQKARDATRITDLNSLRTWLEQSYQDSGTYPNMWASITWIAQAFIDVKQYVPKLPVDPKTWQKSANSNFDYTYAVWSDSSWISFQIYEVSTHFEQSGNISGKAWKDGWNDANRLEVGISIETLKTQVNRTWNLWTSWVTAPTPTYLVETQPATTPSTAATTEWIVPTWATASIVNTVALIIK